MDEKTLAALKKSIEKWNNNTRVFFSSRARIEADTCPLCSVFYSAKGCDGCPVKAKTGENRCFGTPWYNARNALYEWKCGRGNRDAFREAAKAEADFLRSLLPAEAPTP